MFVLRVSHQLEVQRMLLCEHHLISSCKASVHMSMALVIALINIRRVTQKSGPALKYENEKQQPSREILN